MTDMNVNPRALAGDGTQLHHMASLAREYAGVIIALHGRYQAAIAADDDDEDDKILTELQKYVAYLMPIADYLFNVAGFTDAIAEDVVSTALGLVNMDQHNAELAQGLGGGGSSGGGKRGS